MAKTYTSGWRTSPSAGSLLVHEDVHKPRDIVIMEMGEAIHGGTTRPIEWSYDYGM